MSAATPNEIHLKDYKAPDFLIDRIDLEVDLGEEVTRVRSSLQVRRNEIHGKEAGKSPLVLNGEGMALKSVTLEGRPLGPGDYRLDDKFLTIPGVPASFRLEIETEIKPEENTALEGLYKSSGNFCTQCEAEGFRKITYFLDRPDVMSRYSTRIAAEKARYPVLLSNGNLVERGEDGDGRHWVKWEDPFPKPAYLFALVAGDLACVEDSHTTSSGREVALKIYVEPGNEDKCAHAMRSLKNSMAWDEKVFGLEYDLDIFMIVAVGDFNMGAMENKGLNVFNSKYILARPETATDMDFEGIESVVAHEYFHNWTGNRVTCRDWFQLTLKEGLTVFRDQQFSADMNSAAVKRISDVQRLRAAQFPEDSGPLAHPIQPQSYVEINNFYTATVYEKGAEVIRMIHTLLGPDGFRKGMDLYFERHDGQAVTTEDFVTAMEDASGVDLARFRRWYVQAGTPRIAASGVYDPADRSYTLTLEQSTPATPGQKDKQPLHIPVAMGLLGKDGRDLPLRLDGEETAGGPTRVLDLRESKQSFRFLDLDEAPTPSLLRGFSAPVRLKTQDSARDFAFRMRHDSDPFNRWEAGQQLATKILLDLVEDYRQDREMREDGMFTDAFAALLGDTKLDKDFKASALALPSESYLAQQMDVIDVDAIHAAREFMRRSLGSGLRQMLEDCYRANLDNDAAGVDDAAMGRRRLKNLALAYLMKTDDAPVALCLEQFERARNMTDGIAALSLLAATDGEARDSSLASFYEAWRKDPLVMDKWFTIQATSTRPRALDDVIALLDHPDFTLKNPNRVRSLIGAFASANQVRFHDRNGGGYRFLADRIIELDALNPQIAARLVAPLGQWRRHDGVRQNLMKGELQRIKAGGGLSPDVYEMVTRSLGK